jgi:menaquinone-dependent protoporphyrinogen oxidase
MSSKILVAYDSKHGATAEIAYRIFSSLQQEGHEAELLSLEKKTDPAPYDIIILGSAIYIGQWRKNAIKFLKKNEQLLSAKKTWIFSTGPTGEGETEVLLKGWKYPDNLKDIFEKIAPEDMIIFHGSIDEDKLNKLEKLAIKMVKAPVGDFRDWQAVDDWVKKISESLKKQKVKA